MTSEQLQREEDEGKKTTHNSALSPSEFDGRRLNMLLSSLKCSSWNVSEDGSSKFRLVQPGRHQNSRFLVSHAFSSEHPEEVSQQAPHQQKDSQRLNIDGKIKQFRQRLNCDRCVSAKTADVLPPKLAERAFLSREKIRNKPLAASVFQSKSCSFDRDGDSASSSISSDIPSDCLMHYSQYLLLRHADETKFLSFSSSCVKTNMEHLYYYSYQERIRMSLDYHLSNWEKYQEREGRGNNNKISKSILCRQSETQCDVEEYIPKLRKIRASIILPYSIILIMILSTCAFQRSIIDGIRTVRRILVEELIESKIEQIVQGTEYILTNQTSSISPEVLKLEATAEKSSSSTVPQIKKGEKISFNFLSAVEVKDCCVTEETATISIKTESLAVEDHDASPPKFMEFYSKTHDLLDKSSKFRSDCDEAFTVEAGVGLSKPCANIETFHQIKRKKTTFPESFSLDCMAVILSDSCVICPAETSGIFAIHKTWSDRKNPETVHPDDPAPEEDGESFLETPLIQSFSILLKNFSARLQQRNTRGKVGFWGIKVDKQRISAFGLDEY